MYMVKKGIDEMDTNMFIAELHGIKSDCEDNKIKQELYNLIVNIKVNGIDKGELEFDDPIFKLGSLARRTNDTITKMELMQLKSEVGKNGLKEAETC